MRSLTMLSLILLGLLVVVLLIIGSLRAPPPQKQENFSPRLPLTEPPSGIARCRYGGYTPILTCSYQAFQ